MTVRRPKFFRMRNHPRIRNFRRPVKIEFTVDGDVQTFDLDALGSHRRVVLDVVVKHSPHGKPLYVKVPIDIRVMDAGDRRGY